MTAFFARQWKLVVGAVLVAAGVVLGAMWLRTLPSVDSFIQRYPGESALPAGAPVGIPAWLAWQHFFNAFLLLLVIRTGWVIRRKQRPPAFWTRNNSPLMRLTGRQQRLGIYHWFHLALDGLWVANGVIYVALLFVTGQWMRIVPTSWDIIPNAASAALQYASLSWPTDQPWVNYNALQVLSYFTVVFLLAPIAVLTGLRLSPVWPLEGPLARALPEQPTRRVHGIVLYLFCAFIVIHVALVFLTGALRNLNVMYAGNDGDSWTGFGVFAVSAVVMVVGWLLATPPLLKRIAALSGEVR